MSNNNKILNNNNSEQNLLLEVVRVRVRQRGRLDALLREARLDLRDVDLRAVINRCVLSLSRASMAY